MIAWPAEITDYILRQTRFEDVVLYEMEERAQREGFPIISPIVGPWLHLFTRMTGARRVYELGSGFGYSTWYFADAVRQNLVDAGESTDSARVVHTVWDAQLSADAQVNLERAGLLALVEFHVSEAVGALREAPGGWDIVFMDIDKEGYPGALPVIEEKLRPGGLLLVDNMLWSGTLEDKTDERPSTAGIRELNAMLRTSPRWQYVVLPLRDGLGVAWFKG
jgi:caffeoyl-CoA O-methyltransferase